MWDKCLSCKAIGKVSELISTVLENNYCEGNNIHTTIIYLVHWLIQIYVYDMHCIAYMIYVALFVLYTFDGVRYPFLGNLEK